MQLNRLNNRPILILVTLFDLIYIYIKASDCYQLAKTRNAILGQSLHPAAHIKSNKDPFKIYI